MHCAVAPMQGPGEGRAPSAHATRTLRREAAAPGLHDASPHVSNETAPHRSTTAVGRSQTPTLPCPDVQRPATDSRRDAVGGLTNTTWAARCGRLAVNRRR